MQSFPSPVPEDLVEQAHHLRKRVENSRMYLHEPHELSIAAMALPQLCLRLSIAEDLGTLATHESRNVVRKVSLEDGTLAVLKIVGNVREPGEGELLSAWYHAGLPCVEPLTWGYHRLPVVEATVSYILTRFTASLPREIVSSESARRREALDLVEFIGPFHRAFTQVPRARRWADRMRQHLRWTNPRLEDAGFALPLEWEEKLQRLSAEGLVLIHGDPAGSNILRTENGRLLLDPPGALIALPEADVAQICCQVGGLEHVEELIALAADQNHSVDPSAIAAFAGLNLLVWAGYAVVHHSNPDVPEASLGRPEAHMALAARLLSQFALS